MKVYLIIIAMALSLIAHSQVQTVTGDQKRIGYQEANKFKIGSNYFTSINMTDTSWDNFIQQNGIVSAYVLRNILINRCYSKWQSDAKYKDIDWHESWSGLSGTVPDAHYFGAITQSDGDARYKAIAWSPTWSEVSGKPSFFSGAYADLTGKPTLFSGSYTDLTNKPTLFDGTWISLTGKPTFATVATSGSYTDLSNKPIIPDEQVQSDWNAVSGMGVILNKPTLFSGSYTDLTNKPSLFDGTWTSLTGKPTFATVATSGSYTDLSNKPTIPNAQVQSDWNAVSGMGVILNKPTLFSGSYTDLTNKPSLFDGTWTSLTGKPTFATVATSGSYTDLSNKPTILTDSLSAWNFASKVKANQWTASQYIGTNVNPKDLNVKGNIYANVFKQNGYPTLLGYGNSAGSVSTLQNVEIGYNAGASMNDGNVNVCIGLNSLQNCTSGNSNTCIGGRTGSQLNSSNNVLIGDYSGSALTTGGNNTYIGYNTGVGNSTGSGNVFIGYQVNYGLTNPSNRLAIHNSNTTTPLIGGDFSANTVSMPGAITMGSYTGENKSLDVCTTIAATSYTIAATDNNRHLLFTASTTVTITVPNTLPAGFKCFCKQKSTGQLDFTGTAVTSNITNSLSLYKTRAVNSKILISVDEVGVNDLTGDVGN